MSRYDGDEGVEPTEPYIAAFHAWENQVRDRYRIEAELAQSYMNLLDKYQKKYAECEREKRNAMIWEKEQRMAERERDSLKSAAVCPVPSWRSTSWSPSADESAVEC